jgi:hypothetical protein
MGRELEEEDATELEAAAFLLLTCSRKFAVVRLLNVASWKVLFSKLSK